MAAKHKDRRYKRVSLPKGQKVIWECGKQKETARANTAGMGGLFITTRKPVPAGSVLTLIFDAPGGSIRARAVVRDAKPGQGMGVEFTSLGDDERTRLEAYLGNVSPPADEAEAHTETPLAPEKETAPEKEALPMAAPAKAKPKERKEAPSSPPQRRFARVNLPKGPKVAWQCGDQKGVSAASTMGRGGLFINTTEPPVAGSKLRLLFEVPGGEILATAVVRDARPGQGMGIEFTEIGEQYRARLDSLLKKLLS